MMRSVVDRRWLYIRNFRPDLPYVPYLEYMFRARGYQSWARAIGDGRITPAASAFWGQKPAEELYDLSADPDNVKNLAKEPGSRETLERMRAALEHWTLEINDNGFIPEGSSLEGYEASRVPDAYPLRAAFALARLAADRDPANLPRLITELSNSNEVLRFWAAQGCTMLGNAAAPAEAALRVRLEDPSGSVRVAAAEALAVLGETDSALAALDRALTNLDTPFVALQAANVLDRIGETARPLLPAMKRASRPNVADRWARMAPTTSIGPCNGLWQFWKGSNPRCPRLRVGRRRSLPVNSSAGTRSL